MKRLLILIMAASILGCAGGQLTGSTNNQAMAYLAGKGTAIGIYKISPKVAPSIEQAWMDMMGRSYGLPEISSTELLGFFNGVLLKNIPKLKDDKYGFAGDLAYFLQLYGAEFAPDGVMTIVQPVPMIVAKAFQIGYEGGRSIEEKR